MSENTRNKFLELAMPKPKPVAKKPKKEATPEAEWKEEEIKCIVNTFTKKKYNIFKPSTQALDLVVKKLTKMGFDRSPISVQKKITKLRKKYSLCKKQLATGKRKSTGWPFYDVMGQLTETCAAMKDEEEEEEEVVDVKKENDDDAEGEDEKSQEKSLTSWSSKEVDTLLKIYKDNTNYNFINPTKTSCYSVSRILELKHKIRRSHGSVKAKVKYFNKRYQELIKPKGLLLKTEKDKNWKYYEQVKELVEIGEQSKKEDEKNNPPTNKKPKFGKN